MKASVPPTIRPVVPTCPQSGTWALVCGKNVKDTSFCFAVALQLFVPSAHSTTAYLFGVEP
ncbi:hypothetical protein EYF80_038383 [Liparis tanakae]|uniref:Uncharacterized protein n=1 Tax=Liparis tanakae TaxID=230148 RepID=A0A4Z2GDR2_9TELE|nr:hypothetical protein EYF80_038383 [Liparis tanakae]